MPVQLDRSGCRAASVLTDLAQDLDAPFSLCGKDVEASHDCGREYTSYTTLIAVTFEKILILVELLTSRGTREKREMLPF